MSTTDDSDPKDRLRGAFPLAEVEARSVIAGTAYEVRGPRGEVKFAPVGDGWLVDGSDELHRVKATRDTFDDAIDAVLEALEESSHE